jgi:hypothetical protein
VLSQILDLDRKIDTIIERHNRFIYKVHLAKYKIY